MSARSVALVFAGGVLGTAAREAVVLAVPAGGGVPWGVLAVNLLGAFALGLLVGLLTRRAETPRARDTRLFLGTGVLGGFTTYSALASDTVVLFERMPAAAVAYAVGSVVAGVAAAALGLAVGGTRHPSRSDAGS